MEKKKSMSSMRLFNFRSFPDKQSQFERLEIRNPTFCLRRSTDGGVNGGAWLSVIGLH